MTVRNARFSDVSGTIIANPADVVTIVVQDHPLIEEPVVLDLSRVEADAMDVEDEEFVVIDVVIEGEDGHYERVIMKQAAFDGMFQSMSVDDALSGAARYSKPGRGRSVGSAGPKVNYRELPHAGIPHRGRVTDEEAAVVRASLEQVNQNRRAAGYEPIEPSNERDAVRYGFTRPELPRPTPAPRA